MIAGIKPEVRPSDAKCKEIMDAFSALPLPSKYHYDILNGTLGTIETDKAVGFRCPFADGSKKTGLLWFPKSKMRIMPDGTLCVQTDLLTDADRKRPDLFFPEIASGHRILSL